jgi:hypothetical protein
MKASDATIDEAFRHVMQRTGWPPDEVVYQLTEALLAGRAHATCHHSIDGKLQGSGQVRPDFWRDHLALQLVGGRAEVRALKAQDPGVWEYRLPTKDLEALVNIKPTTKPPPRRSGPANTHDWMAICAEIAARCIDHKSRRLTLPKDEAKFRDDLLEWCGTALGKEPSLSETREAIRRMLARLKEI